MGTSTPKSTRKFSKRHLKKRLEQRRKAQWVNKQKGEREEKLQKAARSVTEKRKEEQERKREEEKVEADRQNFLQKPSDEEEDDLEMHELTDLEEEEVFDTITADDVQFPIDIAEVRDAAEVSDVSDEGMNSEDANVDVEISKYKEQLARLKEQDPEFHRYLQQADDQLLQFNISSDDNDDVATSSAAAKGEVPQLNMEQIEKWCQDLLGKEENLESLKFLMTAYAFACQYGETTENESEDVRHLLQFSNPTVYSKVMIFALKEAPNLFRKYLGLHENKKNNESMVTSATKAHPDVTFQMNRFFMSTCRLLRQPLEDNVLAFVLKQIRSAVRLMEGSPAKVSKLFLQASLEIFSTAGPAPRLQAVLLIREMVLTLGENTVNLCLKGIYKTFMGSCAVVSRKTVPHIYFMGTCMIEIYSLVPESAYQNAFKFIKDLAVDLREAIISKDKDSWKKVFSWRFVHCLELWARLVGALVDKGDMRQLVYPLAQLLTGAARVQDQMRHVAIRLRLIAAANQLAVASGVFIPVSSLLLGVLSWSNLQKKPVMSDKEKGPNLALCLSVDDRTLQDGAFQSEVFELLAKHLSQFANTIAFPETSHWIAVRLKKFAKGVQFPSYKSGAMQLAAAIKDSSERVSARRIRVTFSPKDFTQVQQFEAEGKAIGKTPLELLSERLETKRKRRSELQSADTVIVQEPAEEAPAKRARKKEEEQRSAAMSDTQSLESDQSNTEQQLRRRTERLGIQMPEVEDTLQEYVLSDEEALEGSHLSPTELQKQSEDQNRSSKQKRRKEKRKINRQKKKQEHA